MGLFSWDCKECEHPMLSEYATNNINQWMNDVVVIESDGSILKGAYDGYGRVGELEITFGICGHEFTNEPCCYHNACWENAGEPTEYKPSQGSNDQGYFFDEGEHDMEEPT
jgi:hypothetical protein